MGKFSTSYNLVKLSLKIINKEKELLVYSLLSAISVILVVLSFFAFVIGLSFTGVTNQSSEATSSVIDLVLSFLFYFGLTFVGLFFNTAIITSVERSLKGENNSFFDGIKSAFANIHKILIWTFVSAVISTILKAIQDRVPFVAKIVVAIVGAVWNIATFFAFPLIILGNRKTMDALKESPMMFKKGWGETVIANVGVGFFFSIMIFLLFILSILFVVISVILESVFLAILTLVIFVIGFVLLLLLSSTTDAVLKTLLYIYIQTGSLPNDIDLNVLGQMFKEKEVKQTIKN